FEVVRTDTRFGGFEEVKLKDGSTHTRFFRKSMTPGDISELPQVSELKSHIMKDGLSGAVHPIYTHEGQTWILFSLPDEHYSASPLAA
ncbi:hypothetical protein OBBRIDRAFT_790958, partial [Obba rivulosa]